MNRASRVVTVLIVLCLAALGAELVLLVRSGGGPSPAANGPLVEDEAPAWRQNLGKFIALDAPGPAPEVHFRDRDGKALTLADFRGHTVLVNLWATWCIPCIKEMPSLDRLQARLGDALAILALSEDRGGADVVDPFLKKLELKALAIYLDPKNEALRAFAAHGLPTSVLIDPTGRLVGRLEGAAAWDAPAMLGVLKPYLPEKAAERVSPWPRPAALAATWDRPAAAR